MAQVTDNGRCIGGKGHAVRNRLARHGGRCQLPQKLCVRIGELYVCSSGFVLVRRNARKNDGYSGEVVPARTGQCIRRCFRGMDGIAIGFLVKAVLEAKFDQVGKRLCADRRIIRCRARFMGAANLQKIAIAVLSGRWRGDGLRCRRSANGGTARGKANGQERFCQQVSPDPHSTA